MDSHHRLIGYPALCALHAELHGINTPLASVLTDFRKPS